MLKKTAVENIDIRLNKVNSRAPECKRTYTARTVNLSGAQKKFITQLQPLVLEINVSQFLDINTFYLKTDFPLVMNVNVQFFEKGQDVEQR